MSIKSIPLKTWEVQATLDDRKSTLRRVVKMNRSRIYKAACSAGRWSETFGDEVPDEIADWYAREVEKSPYHPGDVLWVRETWHKDAGRYIYKADYSDTEQFFCAGKEVKIRWSNSIHMPRKAARLFLRVTAVRVERLQTIDNAGAKSEGVTAETDNSGKMHRSLFVTLWNSTIKSADLPLYGWAANPFVWVVEFERSERPEGWV